jgi:hypothetical protein
MISRILSCLVLSLVLFACSNPAPLAVGQTVAQVSGAETSYAIVPTEAVCPHSCQDLFDCPALDPPDCQARLRLDRLRAVCKWPTVQPIPPECAPYPPVYSNPEIVAIVSTSSAWVNEGP